MKLRTDLLLLPLLVCLVAAGVEAQQGPQPGPPVGPGSVAPPPEQPTPPLDPAPEDGPGATDRVGPTESPRQEPVETPVGEAPHAPVLDRDELLAFLEDRAAREAPTEVLVERLDQVLRLSLERWDRVQDYQGFLEKRERIKGKLYPTERLQVKYKGPSSQYLRWVKGDKTGREILYAEDLNQGRMMRVLPAFLPMMPDQIHHLNPGSAAALEGTRHPHTAYRLGDVLGRFVEVYWRARLAGAEEPRASGWTSVEGLGELDAIRYRGKRRLHKGTRCFVFDIWYPYRDARGSQYPYRQAVVGFDPESLLLVVFEAYRAQPQIGDRNSIPVRRAISSEESFYSTRVRELDLVESYHFQQLEVDQGLPEEHFSPTNPEYGFRRWW